MLGGMWKASSAIRPEEVNGSRQVGIFDLKLNAKTPEGRTGKEEVRKVGNLRGASLFLLGSWVFQADFPGWVLIVSGWPSYESKSKTPHAETANGAPAERIKRQNQVPVPTAYE